MLQVDVLGIPVSAGAFVEALDEVERWVAARAGRYVTFLTTHAAMEAQRSAVVASAQRNAGLVAADGMPIVWACRWAGAHEAERVYGPDFVLALSERARCSGWRTYFYGGKPGVADRLAERLSRRYPGLRIVGTYTPPFRTLSWSEDEDVIARINDARPDILWVGLGTPKQELWMAAHVGRVKAGAILGVGAAFDLHSGTLPQAPIWMQRSGLEWLFRMGLEPRRLAGRYLLNNPRFVSAILRHPPRRIA